MNKRIFELLATYPMVVIQEAYTNETLGIACVGDDGRVGGYGMSRLVPKTLDPTKIPEIRLLASESPIIYYETSNSEKFLKGGSKLPTKAH